MQSKICVMESYKRFVLLGIIIIAMGIVFANSLENISGSLGTVLIAVGILFLIIGMSKKRTGNNYENENNDTNKN